MLVSFVVIRSEKSCKLKKEKGASAQKTSGENLDSFLILIIIFNIIKARF